MGFAVRQRYDLLPTDPRYLAMDDIQMQLELKALGAFRALVERKPLPGVQSDDYAVTDDFDDLAYEIEHSLIPDDWETVDPMQIEAPA